MKRIILIVVYFFAANCSPKKSEDNTIPKLEGEWGDCNGYSDCIIHIQKKEKILILSSDEGVYTLEKKSNDLYVGAGGLVTLIYDDPPEVKKNPDYREKMLKIADTNTDSEIKEMIIRIVSKHWYLSGICEGKVTLCRHSEVSQYRNLQFQNNESLTYLPQ